MRILIALLLASLSISAASLRDGIAATTIDGVSSAASVDGVTAISISLDTGLVSYWDMDEASGNALDSEPTGTAQELTDNATVTTAAGKIGTARQFTAANTEYFSRADSADMSTGTDVSFTIAAWVYIDATTGSRAVVTKYSGASGGNEYFLQYSATSSRFAFFSGIPASASVNSVTANTFGAISDSTWYFVVAVHDAANDLNYISVNAGTQDSGAASEDPPDSNSSFVIGATSTGSAPFNGRIDEVGFWKRALTTAEITELYNAGSGVTCCAFP